MSVKDYKGREIIVSIKDDPNAAKKKRRRGMVPPVKPPDDFLPRRRKQDNQIYIRIWDLGRNADGSDISFVFGSSPTLSFIDTGGGFVNYFLTPTAVNYSADLNAAMLAGAGSWEVTNFEINTNDLYFQYGINIAGDPSDAFEPTKGFPIGGGILTQNHGNAFRPFDTADAGHFKITASPSFAAAVVPFTLDADAKVYLVPTLPKWYGRAFTFVGFDKFDWQLNGFLRPFPRSFFINNAAWTAQFGRPAFRGDVFHVGVPPRPVYPSALRDAWRLAFTGDTNSHLFKIKFFEAFGTRFYDSDTQPGAGTFPNLTTPGVQNDPFALPAMDPPTIQAVDGDVPAGLLVAAIEKAGSWFYVWNISQNSVFSRGSYQLTV